MWKKWTNVVISLWLAAAPWLLGTANQETRVMINNCVLSGLLVASFSLWAALSKGQKWQELAVPLLCIPGRLQRSVDHLEQRTRRSYCRSFGPLGAWRASGPESASEAVNWRSGWNAR